MWTAIWVGVAVGALLIAVLAINEFLLWIRQGVLWYWRIPEQIRLMEEIRDELRALNVSRDSTELPAVFTWRSDR